MEQNGIDILCDAAGSDLLLSSAFPVPMTANPAAPQGQPHHHHQQLEGEQSRLKRPKTDATPSSSSTGAGASHVCHLCRRVYERADHLTRHMRSHENARQYQCSRCQKRFNRADLLTRHETTHDRDGDGKGRTIIRRSDRAAEACHNCAASKAKCDDQKPCSRCRTKNLPCETTPKKALQYRTASDANSVQSPSVVEDGPTSAGMTTNTFTVSSGYGIDPNNSQSAGKSVSHAGVAITNFNDVLPDQSMLDGLANDMVYFNQTNNFFPDVDFTSWDLNFEGFAVPQFDSHDTSPHSSVNTTSKSASRAHQDTARRHAAFKRSPWLWEPQQTDYVRRDTEGLQMDEDAFSHALPIDRPLIRSTSKLKLTTATRDRLFAIVLASLKDTIHVPSFPSLDLLNYLLHVHLLNDEYQIDSWVHSPSFKPQDTLPELLGVMIAHGASFISMPSVWQFGLALQEIVRVRHVTIFESSNSNTRRLECLQMYMLNLDIGIWSGFKRRTELAESFLQPLMTMLRRAGVFTQPPDTPSILPLRSDSPEALEAKWQKFITRESYKRLVLHIFFHDVQSSISLQKNPLMSFTELSFCLPAARDLWKARSAEAWRDIYLAKRPLPADQPLPRVAEVMHCVSVLDELAQDVDPDLCHMTLLHGFWGQIAAYREGVRFYQPHNTGGWNNNNHASNNQRNHTHRLLLKSQHQELYRDLGEFSTIIYTSRKLPTANLAIVAELLMMTLHVSLDDLQKFAGKAGEEEARRAAVLLDEGWAQNPEARYAVWHAGQVLHNARKLPPTSLKGFNAMAVYFATLTLWVYGLLSCSRQASNNHADADGGGRRAPLLMDSDHPQQTSSLVVLDGEETKETRAFLQLNRGVPGLNVSGNILQQRDQQQHHHHQHQSLHGESDSRGGTGGGGGVEALSNPGMALAVGRSLFRENFPVSTEPLPPLVESLVNLLRDLGSGPAGRPSRAASENSQ